MTWKEFKLKIKKRWHYFLAKRKTIETYFMKVTESTKDVTTFNYYGQSFQARLKDSSDYDIVRQVILNGEYALAAGFFNAQNIKPNVIIDAGSNIGASTIYFKNLFPKALVFCVEPDDDNFELLSKNVSNYISEGSVFLYKAGLMGKSGLNLVINKEFRDKSSCARQVSIENEAKNLKSVTITDLLEGHSIEIIDLLKMDIEGAEKFLIEKDTDVSFLDITRCIAIEVHDEIVERKNIYELLKRKGFILFEQNETTFGIKKELC